MAELRISFLKVNRLPNGDVWFGQEDDEYRVGYEIFMDFTKPMSRSPYVKGLVHVTSNQPVYSYEDSEECIEHANKLYVKALLKHGVLNLVEDE